MFMQRTYVQVAQEACAVRMHVVLHVVPNPDEFDYLDMTAWWNGAKHRTDKAKRSAVVGERGEKEKKQQQKQNKKNTHVPHCKYPVQRAWRSHNYLINRLKLCIAKVQCQQGCDIDAHVQPNTALQLGQREADAWRVFCFCNTLHKNEERHTRRDTIANM